MKQEVLIGQTDYTVLVKIRDDAGAPATGLDNTDIDIAYARVETDNDVTTSDVTPASLSALTDAHSDWGFKEVSATDHPGLYRLDIADAVFASGAWSAVVTISGAGLDPADLEFVLVAFNPRDGVRLGLTALPNAAAEAAGGLYTRGSGAGQINQNANGQVDANTTHLAGTAYASADLSATMKASVNTEADTALSDYGALKPTTAGRTLDVTAGGEAGVDWANIGSPTTTVNLSGTTVKTATDVETDTQDI